MKTENNILIAFLLNLFFSIIEIIGGIFTNSISILSDAVHDLFDSLSIFISYILEKKSRKKSNSLYTYGYKRYSVLGAFITSFLLLISSLLIIYHSILRIFNPAIINYNGMILIAIFGIIINSLSAYFTKDGDSLNQRAVNLHMFEDVFGWLIVLIGGFLIKITKILWIDSVISVIVSVVIILRIINHLNEVLNLFLLKTPVDIDVNDLKKHILSIDEVKDVHHLHIWSLDGINNFATLHIVTNGDVKDKIRNEMKEFGINNVTIEVENEDEVCSSKHCVIKETKHTHHHH